MIIPSFHRPEVVNYIAEYFSRLNSGNITAKQLIRMVQLIDYACARPLSYRIADNGTVLIHRNVQFTGRTDSAAIPTLDIDVANMTSSLSSMKEWVSALAGLAATSGMLTMMQIESPIVFGLTLICR